MTAHDINLFGDQIAASRLGARFAAMDARALLRLAIEDLYPGRIALVSSFGADSAVLAHMVAGIDRKTPLVFIDTGHLFPETLSYRDRLVDLLKLENVHSQGPDPEALKARDPEVFLWSSNPDACCELRKVEPLAVALKGYDAWITGRKRFQAATRSSLPLFEADGAHVKVNPLVSWTMEDVVAYLDKHDLPRHPLVAKGYPSIGCLPCTSPVKPGEDPRAGRWRGRGKTECGIHTQTLDAGQDI